MSDGDTRRRSSSSTRFAASAFLLVGILAVVAIHARQTGVTTFDVRALATTRLSGTAGVLLFLAFTAAFAVKAPVFPFHTWSPDAYREAPAAGAVILAGVMAKLGTYGIVRFDLELFPQAVVTLAPLLLTLGVVGIIYGGVVAAVQHDLKRLIAYSSLAHIGFIVIGTVRPHRAGVVGGGAPDGEPRALHGGPVPARGDHLPAFRQLLHEGPDGSASEGAGVGRHVHRRHAGVHRRAGVERVRGRVPHPRRGPSSRIGGGPLPPRAA